MIEIRMPRLSEGMAEGKLLLWNVAVGDHVKQGDQVAEVEADKANMEIEAPVAGVVCSLNGKPGDTIAVDTVLVELKEELSHDIEDAPVDASVAQPKPQTVQDPEIQSPLERRNKQFSSTDQES
jgi:pyruvate/2-oxoglutarate dehydrogenase complex dihydrolipoamide acyltransferase (E2) component